MATLKTTIGQLVVNHGLPEDLRDYSRVLDKKGLEKLLQTVAEKHPTLLHRHAIAQQFVLLFVQGDQRLGDVVLQHLRQSLAVGLWR